MRQPDIELWVGWGVLA